MIKSKEIRCPACDSSMLLKDGQKNGEQRYKCKKCGKKFSFGLYVPTIKENIPNKNLEILTRLIEKKGKERKIINKFKWMSHDEINKIIKQIPYDKIQVNKDKLFNILFKYKDEKIDEIIIKLFMKIPKKGIPILMNYMNDSNCPDMTNFDYNILGKSMSKRIDISWNIVKGYIKPEITRNCAYAITRYMNYVSKLSYIELKKYLDIEDLKKIYFDKSLYREFSLKKIADSKYDNNLREFYASISKILDKVSKAELINYDYIEQYNNSIFTENSKLEYCLKRVKFCTAKKEEYDKLVKLSSTNVSDIPYEFMPAFPILSKIGIETIGDKLSIFYDEYIKLKFSCVQKDFNIWLDKYTQFIYKTILTYGKNSFKSFFITGDWADEFISLCRINSKETEKLAVSLLKELFSNPCKKIDSIERAIFGNLLYYISSDAMDIFIKRINSGINISQYLSFYFILGLSEKLYGNIFNITDFYTYSHILAGNVWEKIVGCILYEKFDNVKKHPILENKKIPDYALISNNKIDKIIECKLVLGFSEFKETIEKYSSFSNEIDFYCMENKINEEIINSEEYAVIMSNTTKHFEYTINDFNSIYEMTNAYEDFLTNFKISLKDITPENLLKEKVFLSFEENKIKKIIFLINNTLNESGLF